MKKNLSPENTAKVISGVAIAATRTWDMNLDEATSLVEAAVRAWDTYTGENHYRRVMASAMEAVAPRISEYVLDDIVMFIENEQGSVVTAEWLRNLG